MRDAMMMGAGPAIFTGAGAMAAGSTPGFGIFIGLVVFGIATAYNRHLQRQRRR